MMVTALLTACNGGSLEMNSKVDDTFSYKVEKFDEFEILRYRVDGFEQLTLDQKLMIYDLAQAALFGRDILYDQNGRRNLAIRRTLEAIYEYYAGDRNGEDFRLLELYLKQVWFANGIHNDYSSDKFQPQFSQTFFTEVVKSLDPDKLPLETEAEETADELLAKIVPVMFDPAVMPKRLNQTAGEDLVMTSASNYYDGVTQKEVEIFYGCMKDPEDETPVMYGLNSKVTRQDGNVIEIPYITEGLYGPALKKVSEWLSKAAQRAENDLQRKSIDELIRFYQTGDLNDFDAHAICWVKNDSSMVDYVNGFTESYGDPLGMKASWESIVNFRNVEASKRSLVISRNAQWFEDHSPVDARFKKEVVKGVSAKVISVAMLGGDCYPATPIGINLPNSNWIRRDHGSKSVTVENITEAYDKASQGNGLYEEFAWSDAERNLMTKYGFESDNMHTDLHECLGHGSGKLLPGVDSDALGAYGSPLEETRADLFALYYLADPKMVELGLLPDQEAYKAEYYRYMMNGLMTQLMRIAPGKNIEEAHMRNRQAIAAWILEKGASDSIVNLEKRDGKTYVVIRDYEGMRKLAGELLAEVQRMKSEGDFNAGKSLIERYGVKVDPILHAEVLKRYETLHIAPYKGFVNPRYELVKDSDGNITDVTVSYGEGYADQMMRYSKDYATLPTNNDYILHQGAWTRAVPIK